MPSWDALERRLANHFTIKSAESLNHHSRLYICARGHRKLRVYVSAEGRSKNGGVEDNMARLLGQKTGEGKPRIT